MGATTMTTKGQFTMPKEVRDDLGLKPGDRIEFVKRGGEYVLKVRNVRAADLAGFLGKPPNGRHVTIEEMNEAIGQAVAERFEQKTRR